MSLRLMSRFKDIKLQFAVENGCLLKQCNGFVDKWWICWQITPLYRQNSCYRTICHGSLLIDQYCVQFCDLLFPAHHKLSIGLNLQLKVLDAVNCLCIFSTVGTAGMIWNPWTCRGDYKNRFASPPVRNILCVHYTPFSFICNKSNRRFR